MRDCLALVVVLAIAGCGDSTRNEELERQKLLIELAKGNDERARNC